MSVILLISVLLVVVCGAAPDKHFNKMERDKGGGGISTGITDRDTRIKRAISILAKVSAVLLQPATRVKGCILEDVLNNQKNPAEALEVEGALALRTLLSGSTPIYSSGKRIRNFEKNGNYFTALKDFESVDPQGVVHITSRTGAKFTIGRVGDRKLKVKHPGFHGDTVFDIVDLTQQRLNKPGVPYTDRIIYRKIETSNQ